MKRNRVGKGNNVKKSFSLDCKVNRLDRLEMQFDKIDEVARLHRLTDFLFDQLIESLPGSGRNQLTQYSDAMNRLMCLQAAFYYAHGLSDGATLARIMSEDKLNVTFNVTVM